MSITAEADEMAAQTAFEVEPPRPFADEDAAEPGVTYTFSLPMAAPGRWRIERRITII